MMTLSVVAALLGASCSAFAAKSLRGTPRRTAKRQSLQMNVITDRPARAALAAAYVRHGGAIGGAACATICRALERADDAWWWRSGRRVLGVRVREPATAINALKMVRAVVKWRPDAAAALLPGDCGEACVEASKHSQKCAIELYVACAEAAHDSGKRIMEKLGVDAAVVDGVLASDASIAWRARAVRPPRGAARACGAARWRS